MSKIGVSIRGGGYKSTAYAGALKAFQEKNIDIHAMIGSSGGAIVSASFAFGFTPEEILENFKSFNASSIFSFQKLMKGKLYDLEAWVNYAESIAPGKKLEDAYPKLAIQVTNVESRNIEYIEEGDVAQAVVESSAILPFKTKDGKTYLDAEYDPEFGAEKLKSMGCNITIGVTLHQARSKNSKISLFDRLIDPLLIVQENALELDLLVHPLDHLIDIEIPVTGFFSKKNLERNFNKGYEQTLKFLEDIKL